MILGGEGMIRFAILCLLLLTPITARSQQRVSAPVETLTLEQAIAIALEHNRLIRENHGAGVYGANLRIGWSEVLKGSGPDRRISLLDPQGPDSADPLR